MPTSGLVITLSADAELAAQTRAMLMVRREFTVGERNDHWLPVAMEASDDAGSRDLHDWLHSLPGVEFVDVVYVNFDDDKYPPAAVDVRRLSQSDASQYEGENFLTTDAANKPGEP